MGKSRVGKFSVRGLVVFIVSQDAQQTAYGWNEKRLTKKGAE